MINRAGVLRGWGDNRNHQLFALSDEDQPVPIIIDPPGREAIWHNVSVGGNHMIAIARHDVDRTLWGWGANESGQAGYWYVLEDVVRPAQIGHDRDWKSVSAGLYFSTATKEDGTLWSWGHNQYGQLGYDIGDPDVTSPMQVGLAGGWSSVSAGHYHTLALKGDVLYAWGRNSWGQCGNGKYLESLFEPVYVSSGWKQVSAGRASSAGVKLDGTLWAWGAHDFGTYFGNGTLESSLAPVQVGTDTDWEMVSVGGHGECTAAIKRDGSLWAWGNGYCNGTSRDAQPFPVEILPGTSWTHVSSGDRFALGQRRDGSLWAWGEGAQLGAGGRHDSIVPVQVPIP
jgi:alpha-tubulin suppressor-like RCC1 family protein